MINRTSHNLLNSKGIFELTRYIFVGTMSAFSYYTGSNIINLLKAPSIISSGLGWVASLIVSYFGHAKITYRVKTDHKRMGWKFIVLCLANFIYATSVTYLFFDILKKPYFVASGIVTITMPLLAYPMGKFWVFKEKKK